MSQVTFTVYERPQPQGSLKTFILEGKLDVQNPCDRRTGKPNWERKPRVVAKSDNPELEVYRQLVGYECRNAIVRGKLTLPLAAKHRPIELYLEFTFTMPPSVKGRTEMVVKPDIDKLQRAVLDGLTGVLYEDDAQVVHVTVSKSYGQVNSIHVSAHTIEEATLFSAGSPRSQTAGWQGRARG